MGKQRTRDRLREAELGRPYVQGFDPERIPRIFSDHFTLSLQSMPAPRAASNAYDAVMQHLAYVLPDALLTPEEVARVLDEAEGGETEEHGA